MAGAFLAYHGACSRSEGLEVVEAREDATAGGSDRFEGRASGVGEGAAATATAKMGTEVAVWSAGFGAPIGAMAFTARVEGIAETRFNPTHGTAFFLLTGADFPTGAGDVAVLVNENQLPGSRVSLSRRIVTASYVMPPGLNEVILRTLSVINHRLELGEVTPELDLADDLPEVMCDASQIQQIVINLVLNGAEAMEEGTIAVRTRHQEGAGTVTLEVEDSGTGITGENLKKIYDPFFSTKEEGQGTGLGLSISFGIIENHGGRMTIDSEEGAYTRVTIDLDTQGGLG